MPRRNASTTLRRRGKSDPRPLAPAGSVGDAERPANAALRVAEANGGLEEFEGWCLELTDAVMWEFEDGTVDVLWVDLVGHPHWKYHAVPVIGGVVHDAWNPGVMLPPPQYVERVFGKRAESWELNPGGDREAIEQAYARVADAEADALLRGLIGAAARAAEAGR